MNLLKQDRNGVRTPTDVHRRLGTKVWKTEKEVGEHSENINTLNIKSKEMLNNIKIVNDQINKIDEKYEELEMKMKKIQMKVELNTEKIHVHENKNILDVITEEDVNSIHFHENKGILDQITKKDIDNWTTKYIVGDVYMTIETENPKTHLGYGEWTNIATQELSEYICYAWLRIE